MPKHTDIPTEHDIRQLIEIQHEASVSIYMPTSPLPTEADANRIEFKTLAGTAVERLQASGVEKKTVAAIHETLLHLDDDRAFWDHQARSLAVFALPDNLRTFRLPNNLSATVEVGDRFLVKPLLRTVTFPQAAYVLALSVNAARLLEISAEPGVREVDVPDMPKDAVSAVGLESLKDKDPTSRTQGDAGRKLRLHEYSRAVDRAMRAAIGGTTLPLVLAATEPLASIYRATSSFRTLAARTIEGNPDELSDDALSEAARGVLDGVYAAQIDDLKETYETRAGQDRATTDLSRIARAATVGAVDTLLVDIDVRIDGRVDDETGALKIEESDTVGNYGVIDEVAKRVIEHGGRVLAVRKEQVPAEADAAAILRFAAA